MENLNLQLSNKGLFKEPQSIILNKTQTLISGDHGFGKSTIAKCLLDEITGFTDNQLLPWAILLDEESNSLRQDWIRNEFLCSELFKFRRELEELMSWAINKMLESKIQNRFSKLWGIIKDDQTIQASINSDGSFCFKTSDGRNIDNLFIAYGETTVVTIALIYVIRHWVKSELPLITDAIFGCPLDSDLRNSCYAFITKMATQTIILEYPDVLEDLNLKPNFKINYNSELGSSLNKMEL